MRILYDGLIYSFQAAGGINRYFANLISRLPNNFSPSLTTLSPEVVNYPTHPNLKIFKYKKFRPSRLSDTLEKYYLQGLVSLGRFNIAHPTYYSLLSKQEIKTYPCPVILTVWDMIHERFAATMDANGHERECKKKAILAADAIICISENTKKDLLELYSVSEDKIKVTYLASEIDASFADRSDLSLSQPYYLYVGSRDIRYKNFDNLLYAFAKVASVRYDVNLYVVGSQFNPIENQLITDLNLSDRVKNYGYTNDMDLAKLYHCSIAFIYPSLYEGFGIPPLEAMCCGTPVIAANSSSIPEVVGDAGILFNPKSIDDLADILLFVIDNPGARDRLISQGYQRAKLFSWDKTVNQTIEIYKSVNKKAA